VHGIYPYNLRFPGQIFDGQAGLHQNGFRDYDPAIGRYPQSDPIGLNAGINTYTYTRSNPMRHRDPLGLDIWVEGPSGNEPEFHQSVNVGDPFGTYTSMSYGVGPGCLAGCVYFDQEKGGEIEHYSQLLPGDRLESFGLSGSLDLPPDARVYAVGEQPPRLVPLLAGAL
jgi:RHS repeat-associated protein